MFLEGQRYVSKNPTLRFEKPNVTFLEGQRYVSKKPTLEYNMLGVAVFIHEYNFYLRRSLQTKSNLNLTKY